MEEGVTNQIVVEVARVFDKKTIVMPSQESCRHTFPIVKRGGIPALDKYLFHLGKLSQNEEEFLHFLYTFIVQKVVEGESPLVSYIRGQVSR